MADALTEFQERLKERVKGDIGELMPDSVIKELIEQTITKEFLEPYTTREGEGWYARPVHHPSRLMQYFKPHIETAMLRYVADWSAANPGKLEAVVKEAIGENVEEFFGKAVRAYFKNQFEQFQFNLLNQINHPQK